MSPFRAFSLAAFLPLLVAWQPVRSAAPGARLLSPAGGERWAAGSTHVLRWDGAAPGRPALEYRVGRGPWNPVPESASADRCRFTVPDAAGEICAFRPAGVPGGREVRVRLLPSLDAGYRWTSVTPRAQFAPRDGAGLLSFQDRLWLLGGWNPGDRRHFPRICNNEVWSSPDGRDWDLVKPNTFLDRSFDPASDWEGRHTAGYAVHRGRMWIVGGDVNQGHYHPDVWSSGDGRRWKLENPGRPVPWSPRALHYTAAFRDRLWVMGGQTIPNFAAAPEAFHRDIWRSADGVSWEPVRPREPYWSERGMIGGSAVLHGRLWILGGGTYDTPGRPQRSFYNDVWSTGDGVRWKRHLEAAPWDPRQYHEVAAWDGRLWVLEGYSGRNRNDVWHSADGVNWYELKGTPWKPRHAASVAMHRDALWVVAGNNMESDVWRLDRARPQAPTPGPSN